MKHRLDRWFRPGRRWISLSVIVAVLGALTVALWPSRQPAPIAQVETRIPVAAGPGETDDVELDTTLYLPAQVPAPAVLLAHGFGGSKASVAAEAERLAGDGFVVLAYSARGFGSSSGHISLDSLDHEIPDARSLVDWLATRPEVVLDAAGDPRVGVSGASYGGALSLMLAGTDPRVDAAIPLITWNNLATALFPNSVRPAGSQAATPAAIPGSPDGVFKKYWAAALIASVVGGADLTPTGVTDTGETSGRNGFDSRNSAGSGAAAPAGPGAAGGDRSIDPGCGRLRTDICAAYAQAAQTGRMSPSLQKLLDKSSPAAVAAKITAPTLILQGTQDTLFGLDQADANARAIASGGGTVAVGWFRGGHDGGAPDDSTKERITEWFRHYLAGTGPLPSNGFRYTVDGPISDNGRVRARTLETGGYPGVAGAAAAGRLSLPLSGDEQIVVNPPGGSPAAISSLPGLSGLIGTALSSVSSGLPGQSARFTSEPVAELRVISGSPSVTVSVASVASASVPGDDGGDSGPVLFASLSKINSAGVRTLAGSSVAPVRLPAPTADGSPVEVAVDLPAVSFQVEAGSRVQISFSTTDQAFSGSTSPAVYAISMPSGAVSLPDAGGVRVSRGEIPVATLIALIALAVAAVVGLVLAGRVRRRPADALAGVGAPADSAESAALGTATAPPLRITGLSKVYPGGVAAVQDVSFDVLHGQVLGLLGPNGAGKTTTLRMVMGLISPTDGEIRVFGHQVRPGAEILSRIGSFVEGSGFLPHLSGKANLDLYWRATGRPVSDAHMAEALEIAGLGNAVKRRVKTYSQGMRQRLAIAQAMLGLPDLLLLDEPTNGLDPPQIHAMREVLRRYAATGRTVLVSSHLLSEVEQTCSHVVVVHQGRTIAAGTVAEMVATSGDVVFTLANAGDASRAIQVLTALDGIGEVGPADGAVAETAIQADLGAVSSAGAIRALVGADIDLVSAAPRHRLEDVFLELVGSASKGGDE